jgi:transposase
MHSMTQEQDPIVAGGVDAHADIHHAAALDARGALLGSRQFEATSAGYEQLFAWLSGFGRVQAVAVESTSSYAAGLTRALLAHRIEVVEVNQPHAHTRRRRGKTDAIDAETAARRYLTGRKSVAVPHRWQKAGAAPQRTWCSSIPLCSLSSMHTAVNFFGLRHSLG